MKSILVIILISLSSLLAQTFDGTSLGLAGNYTTMSRGVDALAWNPANLTLPRGNGIEFNLMGLSSKLFNNSFSVSTYNRYFTQEGHGGEWSVSDRNELLDIISDNGFRTDFNVNANVLGMAFNNFGLAVQLMGQGYAALGENKKPFEIALFGETLDRSYKYNQKSQVSAEAFSAMKISIGYAYPVKMDWLRRDLKDVAIGVSWNQYVGIAVVQSRKADVLFQRFPGETEADESIKYAVAMEARMMVPFASDGQESGSGRGQGFDLGFSSGYGRDLDFSLSFSNIGASITWSNGERLVAYSSDSLSFKEMQDDERESTATELDTSYDIASFRTPLPAFMRMGAVYRLSPQWKVSADYHQGLNKAFGNSLTPRVGIGTEYYATNWLPLRAGIALGGNDGSQIGLGFGVHLYFVKLNYSYAMKGALWPTYSKGVLNAIDLKIAF